MGVPQITITSVIPGTAISVNTGNVEVSWSVSNTPPDAATAIHLGGGGPSVEVLEDNTFTDWAGGGSNINHMPTTSGSFTETFRRTYSFVVIASNDDGQTELIENFYSKIPVGYHDATVPGAPVYQSDLDLIGGYLHSLDSLLRDDVLTGLPNFIEEWNRYAPDDYRFPDFSDIDYLSAAVGGGGLSDDLLSAMREVLVYIEPYTMPRGYRPGTLTSPDHKALCQETIRDGEVVGQVLGKSTRQWVAICVDSGGDELTLLHELFHYASTSHNDNEYRAVAVSCGAFDQIPWR